MNLVFIRNKIESDNIISSFIYNKFWLDIWIKYSNSWFIVIPTKSNSVYKYYFDEIYMKNNLSLDLSFKNTYYNEVNSYNFFYENWFIVPKIYLTWEEKIWNYIFSYLEIQNIRISNIKPISFLDFKIDYIVNFIRKIHFLKPWYILWNLDITNFYIDKSGNIWLFDLSCYWVWNIEKDLAKLIFWYKFKYEFIKEIIFIYWKKNINLSILLYELKNVFIENNKLYKNNFYVSFKIVNSLIN